MSCCWCNFQWGKQDQKAYVYKDNKYGGKHWQWICKVNTALLRQWDFSLNQNLILATVTQTLKNLPAMQEAWVRSLDQEDPLEKRMATHSSILAWRILWTEEPGGLQSMASQRVGHDPVTNTSHCYGIDSVRFCNFFKGSHWADANKDNLLCFLTCHQASHGTWQCSSSFR